MGQNLKVGLTGGGGYENRRPPVAIRGGPMMRRRSYQRTTSFKSRSRRVVEALFCHLVKKIPP